MKFVTLAICAFCIGIMNTSAACAENLGQKEQMGMDMRDHGDAQPLSEGTVKKVNASGRITIVHGPLANLGMPAMTMTFGVKDKALLRGIKPGDRVRFRAEQAANGLIVTRLIVIR